MPFLIIVRHLRKRYIDLQRNLPKNFSALVLPDYTPNIERLIDLKGSRVRIYDKKTGKTIKSTSISKYFKEILGKIEETERKYDFFDSAYRNLLMWEGYLQDMKIDKK